MAEIIQYKNLKRESFKKKRNLSESDMKLLDRLKAKRIALNRLKNLLAKMDEKDKNMD